jgi:ATP-dependent protease HslVU (ClpYQ) peptidase subunit
MTCIIGLKHGNHVYIGGDSAGVSGTSLEIRADKKIFKNGDFLFGFTTSFRMGELLQYKFKPPQRHPDIDVYQYMVTDFIDAVRDCLKNGGYARKDREAESGGTFIVGYCERLFVIGDDYQVGEPLLDYTAVGCGEDIAKGAMYTSGTMEPEKRILKALEAAEQFSTAVRKPFSVLKI